MDSFWVAGLESNTTCGQEDVETWICSWYSWSRRKPSSQKKMAVLKRRGKHASLTKTTTIHHHAQTGLTKGFGAGQRALKSCTFLFQAHFLPRPHFTDEETECLLFPENYSGPPPYCPMQIPHQKGNKTRASSSTQNVGPRILYTNNLLSWSPFSINLATIPSNEIKRNIVHWIKIIQKGTSI